MNKNILGILLILLVIVISITSFIISEKEEKTIEARTIKIEELDEEGENVKYSRFHLEDRKSFEFKSLNYPMYLYYKNINEKTFDEIKIYPELKTFLLIEDNYLSQKYGSHKSLFYEVLDIEKIESVHIYKVRHKEEGTNKTSILDVSSNSEYIFDEPFIKIETVNAYTSTPELDINVEAKAVFKNKETYKILLFNKTNNIITIDSGMYGFYAIKDSNKYYHNLVNGTLGSYRLLPNSENTLLVSFNVNNPEEIFVNIENDYIEIIKN